MGRRRKRALIPQKQEAIEIQNLLNRVVSWQLCWHSKTIGKFCVRKKNFPRERILLLWNTNVPAITFENALQQLINKINQTISSTYFVTFISAFLCFDLLLFQSLFLGNHSLSSLVLCQEVCKLLVWSLGKHSLLPHVRGQIAVGLRDGCKCSFGW